MRDLRKLIYLVLVCFLYYACLQEKSRFEPKRTVIAGVIKNFTEEVVLINYCDYFSDARRFAPELRESGGYFQTEHEYLFAQNITIRFANKFVNLFINPGDSVFVTIDANEVQRNFDNAVTFSGANSELNRELFLWHNYFSRLFNQNIPQFDNNASPEDFLASVERAFNNAQDSINAYSERTGMSDFLKNWAYTDCKFTIANYLMDYNNTKANRWDIFTNPIFDVFNENNFQTMYFFPHLLVCRNVLIRDDDEIGRLFSEKRYVPATRLTIEQLLDKAPKGVVRDVMLFDFLKNILIEMPELYDSIPNTKAFFSRDFFNTELERLAEQHKSIEHATKLLEAERSINGIFYLTDDKMEELPDVTLLNFLSEKHKGKVLYLDVWATWCGPCIDEFKSTPNLHSHFKNKDVVFVNLCLSSNIDSWKPTILNNNVSGENYFLGDKASQLFMGDNNLGGFPSYLVIDKRGEVHYPAPRPSDLESAIKKIESCLQ